MLETKIKRNQVPPTIIRQCICCGKDMECQSPSKKKCFDCKQELKRIKSRAYAKNKSN